MLIFMDQAIRRQWRRKDFYIFDKVRIQSNRDLTLNIPSLGRQRCLPSWGPRRTPFFVISQLFDAVDYSNYVFLGF